VLSRQFSDTLEAVASCLNGTDIPWMLFGGAAMAVHEKDDSAVKDIDIVLRASDAIALSRTYDWPNHADTASSRFRSDVLLRPRMGHIPVELLGGFRICHNDEWVGIAPCDAIEATVGRSCVWVAAPPRLAEIFRLCGRPKDHSRAARIAMP